MAGLKDFMALLKIAPHNLQSHVPGYAHEVDIIMASVACTCAFIKSQLLGAFEDAARLKVARKSQLSNNIFVQSPLAGGVPNEHLLAAKGPEMKPQHYAFIGVGVFNPGRIGLSTLEGAAVLWWRLWDIAIASQEAGLQMVILPGHACQRAQNCHWDSHTASMAHSQAIGEQ